MNVDHFSEYSDLDSLTNINHKKSIELKKKPSIDSEDILLSDSEDPKSKIWILTAVSAGLFFGLWNVFLGKTSHYGVYSREVVSVGGCVFAVGYSIIQLIFRYFRM